MRLKAKSMFAHAIADNVELRLLEAQDTQALFRVIQANRDHLDSWLRWSGGIQTLDDTRDLIRRFRQKAADNDGFHAGIWVEGALMGGLVCHAINWESRKTEIGYWLSAEAVGKGLATQAVRAALDYLFGDLKLNRVEILCAVDNERSRAIPKRLGFTQEGVLRQAHWITNRYVDHALYAMLAEEWR